MDFLEAFNIMKKGGTVFKKQNPDILYTAKFDDATKNIRFLKMEKSLEMIQIGIQYFYAMIGRM